ncbi:hypothetical protein LDC_0599 [sediment metagenome]|uniref:Uncharacterized protein n=1 Tax=sediment metagenome TaxID=749907 RepID=D9PGF2_9ZZZZ
MDVAGIKNLAGYIKNPEIDFNFIIKGVNFDNENSIGNVENTTVKSIKFNTDIVLKTETYYDSSPFQNYGGPSPVVGKETTYTIT